MVKILQLFLFVSLYFINKYICQFQEGVRPNIKYVSKSPTILKQGEVKTLNCTVENLGPYSVSWIFRHNDQNTIVSSGESVISSDPRYSIHKIASKNKAFDFQLTIDKIKSDDAGDYICQLNIDKIHKIINVFVITSPLIGDDISGDLVALEGQTVTLRCNATGYPTPTICWKKEGAPLPNGKALHCNNTLVIHNVTKYDRGRYFCIANNDYAFANMGNQYQFENNGLAMGGGNVPVFSNNFDDSSRKPVELLVEFRPEFPVLLNNPKRIVAQTPNRNFHAILECHIQAYPAPKTWWTKVAKEISSGTNEKQIHDNFKYEITYYPDQNDEYKTTTTLKILQVQNQDFGHYRCHASNTQGSASYPFELIESSVIVQEYGSINAINSPSHTSYAIKLHTNWQQFCFAFLSIYLISIIL